MRSQHFLWSGLFLMELFSRYWVMFFPVGAVIMGIGVVMVIFEGTPRNP